MVPFLRSRLSLVVHQVLSCIAIPVPLPREPTSGSNKVVEIEWRDRVEGMMLPCEAMVRASDSRNELSQGRIQARGGAAPAMPIIGCHSYLFGGVSFNV